MKRRVRWLVIVVASVGAVVALLATGLGRDPSLIASPLVGHRAPNFTLPQFDGPPLTLSKLRGQIVVLNFWASWCTECKVEQAALDRTWHQFQNSGVVLVGVDFEDDTTDARHYAQTAGMSYPIVEDANSHTALAYGLRGVPETFVLNRSGRIIDHMIGPIRASQLIGEINSVLNGSPR